VPLSVATEYIFGYILPRWGSSNDANGRPFAANTALGRKFFALDTGATYICAPHIYSGAKVWIPIGYVGSTGSVLCTNGANPVGGNGRAGVYNPLTGIFDIATVIGQSCNAIMQTAGASPGQANVSIILPGTNGGGFGLAQDQTHLTGQVMVDATGLLNTPFDGAGGHFAIGWVTGAFTLASFNVICPLP
jgi:hypothetical protein